ncbi:hypothetical protein D3C79_995880 [compost metagenome]
MRVTRQAFQQCGQGLQALCVQVGERLARAVPSGQLKRAGTAFAAALQQAEFVVHLLKVSLADEAEPTLQQGICFVRVGACAELQVDVPK